MDMPEKIYDDGFIVKYLFEDERGKEYMVQFKNDHIDAGRSKILGKSYEMAYFAKNDAGQWDARVVSNSGSPFKTMDMVFGKALEMFLKEKIWVSRIWMEGLPKEGEEIPSKRTRLYVRHLGNNPIRGYSMRRNANLIELIKNDRMS